MVRLISSGVWTIYVQAEPGGKRLVDGEATHSAQARDLFHRSVRDAPPTTRVELVNPAGDLVDHSQGASAMPRSSAVH